MSEETRRELESALFAEVDTYLSDAWPTIMQEWQESIKHVDPRKRSIALVTRTCNECGTKVRVGAIMNRLSPNRPAGDRAYCAHCKKVTDSPIVEVRGLAITDVEEDE